MSVERNLIKTPINSPDQICFCTHNSSLEGATKLKFAPFCYSRDALSDGIKLTENYHFSPCTVSPFRSSKYLALVHFMLSHFTEKSCQNPGFLQQCHNNLS